MRLVGPPYRGACWRKILSDSISPEVLSILAELSLSPRENGDQAATLGRVVHLCKKAMRCKLCTVTSLDADKTHLYEEARAGESAEEATGRHLLVALSRGSKSIDLNLVTKGEIIEKYDLQSDGQGVANSGIARKLGLDRMMGHALRVGSDLRGYLNIFSSGSEHYTKAEKELLAIFANKVEGVFERGRQQSAENLLAIVTSVCRSLASEPPRKSLKLLADGVSKLLDVPTCVVWEYDEKSKRLRIAATTENVDEEYRLLTLDPKDPYLLERIEDSKDVYIADVTASESKYLFKEAAAKRNWVSLLTVPIHVNHRLSGMLDVYMNGPRQYERWERDALVLFAQETALALLGLRGQVEELNGIVQELTEARTEEALFEITLRRALDLVGGERGWISKLDVRTGEQVIVAEQGLPSPRSPIMLNQGVSGTALRTRESIRVDDVRKFPGYKECWSDTRSELAVPIVMRNVEIHEGTNITHGYKLLGVLNVESPQIGAFYSLDEERLQTLVRQAALVYDRIDTDRKFARLSQIEKDFTQAGRIKPSTILEAITETLEFEFVNISLVDYDAKRIKTRYITGRLSEEEKQRFKQMADHPLDGDKLDIQADIVRTRRIEVPDEKDPRFDPMIYREFGHDKLIRLFVPMISHVDNQVIGVVEAGYKRAVRPFIYERDVRLLKDFVDFVTVALHQSRQDVLEKIMHDLRAPAVALWADVEYLARKFKDLPDYRIQNKFDDLALDSELVLLQVSEVERFFGAPPQPTMRERSVVFRDIVIKSLNQIRGLVSKSGYDSKKIQYDPKNKGKMVLFIDPVKLNDVVLNLLMNSVKYAEDDPSIFAIHVDLEETRTEFILKFKDWGIGIKPQFAKHIFEAGFRAPEAKARSVTGSGLGLSISRSRMREIGGDLILANNYKPTEFHIILPKVLKEQVNDPIR